MLDALLGPDPLDPVSAQAPVFSAANGLNKPVAGLRIWVLPQAERAHVALHPADVGDTSAFRLGDLQHLGRVVEAGHLDPILGQPQGDAAGAAGDLEDALVRGETGGPLTIEIHFPGQSGTERSHNAA